MEPSDEDYRKAIKALDDMLLWYLLSEYREGRNHVAILERNDRVVNAAFDALEKAHNEHRVPITASHVQFLATRAMRKRGGKDGTK